MSKTQNQPTDGRKCVTCDKTVEEGATFRELNNNPGTYRYKCHNCENDDVNEDGVPKQFPVQNERLKIAKSDDFQKIPGSPIVYWVSDKLRALFSLKKIGSLLKSDGQLLTGNNEKFLRNFWEINSNEIGHDKSWKLHQNSFSSKT